MPLLWPYANNSDLHLSCARKIIDHDTSEFIIAVHSELPVASDIALKLSKETFEQEDNSLQDLREATVAVVVERNVNVAYHYQKPEGKHCILYWNNFSFHDYVLQGDFLVEAVTLTHRADVKQLHCVIKFNVLNSL